MSDERPPIIDRRNAQQVAAQVEHLAVDSLRQEGADWAPSDGDPGRTLARLFGHLMEHVIARLNRVPDKLRMAFADLAGLEPLPPLPARVPVTFTAWPGNLPVVPRGTVLDAEPADGDPDPLQYETEDELTVQSARLVMVLGGARRDDTYADGATERWLYLTHPLLELAVGAPSTAFTITATAGLAGLQAWDGKQWRDVDAADPAKVVLASPARCVVAGREAAWLRLPPGPLGVHHEFRVALRDEVVLVPDAALVQQVRVEPTSSISPFGPSPVVGDALHLRCDRAFALAAAADISVTFSGLSTTPDPSDDLAVEWQYWRGSEWKTAQCTDGTARFTKDGTVTFLGGFPDLTLWQGGLWLRVVLARGTYERPLDPEFTPMATPPAPIGPPRFASVRIGVRARGDATLAALVRQDGARFTPLPNRPAVAHPSLLLGFDSALANRATSLFVEVLPAFEANAGAPPAVRWSYSTAEGWRPLTVVDGTDGLRRTGIVTFIGPADMAVREEVQRVAAWIKAELAANEPLPVALGLLRLNTVWASQAVTIPSEHLGPATGLPSQRFRTTRTPVLAGEFVEVAEPEPFAADTAPPRWLPWAAVADLRSCAPADRCYHVDRHTGVLTFGDGIHGAIPPQMRDGVRIRYRAGGGLRGDRPAGAMKGVHGNLTGIDRARNDLPAVGGRDPEDDAAVVARTARWLRHRGRSVAVQDYADLALEASPRVGRAWVVPLDFDPFMIHADPLALPRSNTVQVIVVPRDLSRGPLPEPALLADVAAYLRARAPAGVEVDCAPPTVLRLFVTTRLIAAGDIEPSARAALTAFLDPLRGGPDGQGFAPGSVPRPSDLVRALVRVPGLRAVASLELAIKDHNDIDRDPGTTDLLVLTKLDIRLDPAP